MLVDYQHLVRACRLLVDAYTEVSKAKDIDWSDIDICS
jgi:hypothetical protein